MLARRFVRAFGLHPGLHVLVACAEASQTLQKSKNIICNLVSGLPAVFLNAESLVSMLPEPKLGWQTKKAPATPPKIKSESARLLPNLPALLLVQSDSKNVSGRLENTLAEYAN